MTSAPSLREANWGFTSKQKWGDIESDEPVVVTPRELKPEIKTKSNAVPRELTTPEIKTNLPPICKFFNRKAGCDRSDTCRFRHEKFKCLAFHRNQVCDRDGCPWSHETDAELPPPRDDRFKTHGERFCAIEDCQQRTNRGQYCNMHWQEINRSGAGHGYRSDSWRSFGRRKDDTN